MSCYVLCKCPSYIDLSSVALNKDYLVLLARFCTYRIDQQRMLRRAAHMHNLIRSASLLAYLRYGSRRRLRLKHRLLAPPDTTAWALLEGFCANAISTELSSTGSNNINENDLTIE